MNTKIDTIYGFLSLDEAHKDDIIFNSLKEYGEWGLLECYFASKILPPGYLAFDVGAFIGTFSLGLSMFGASKVISVEPNPVVLPNLEENLNSNCAIPYQIVPKAVGIVNDNKWSFMVDSTNLGGSHLTEWQGGEITDLITLSDLRTKYGDYDFIKIDAEGHEEDILKSDIEFISKKCQVIFLEENEEKSNHSIIDMLLNNNFLIYLAIFPAFNANNYKGSNNRLFNIACEANIIASRKEIHMEDGLKRLGCDLNQIKNIEDYGKMRSLVPRWGINEWAKLSKVQLEGLLYKTVISYQKDTKMDLNDIVNNIQGLKDASIKN